jgi:DNA-directed RNA polymerase sigma subunit (sigma70/sigma32)
MDLGQAVTAALEHLDQTDRRILELRYGLTTRPHDAAEVAKKLGLSVEDVWAAESYGLETLSFALLTTNDLKPAIRRAA